MTDTSRTGGRFDVMVVGARCAGAPTAMLLAQRGLRVLLVDRSRFPSDTLSTHLVHPPGVAALRRWGLLDEVIASECPPIDDYLFDFGPLVLSGSPGTADSPVSYAPRRTVLDPILVRAAARAGAEVREGFNVTELLHRDGRVAGVRGHDSGGRDADVLADVVVGAEGLRSLVIGGWPDAEFQPNKTDITRHYLAMFDLVPEFAKRIAAATRETRVVGTAVPNYFRTPYGPGWALVGDAGYHRDFITAQGMQDAFRGAELCADALVDALSGPRPFDAAMKEYQSTRDAAVTGMYELTTQLATLEPPSAEMQALLASLAASQDGMDLFARVNAGTTAPSELGG